MADTYVKLPKYTDEIKDKYEIKDVVGDGWCFFYAVNGARGIINIGTDKYKSSEDEVIKLVNDSNVLYNGDKTKKWANETTITTIAGKIRNCIYIYFQNKKEIIDRPIVFQGDDDCDDTNSIYLILELDDLKDSEKELLQYFEDNNTDYPTAIYDLLNNPSGRRFGWHFKFLKKKGGTIPPEEAPPPPPDPEPEAPEPEAAEGDEEDGDEEGEGEGEETPRPSDDELFEQEFTAKQLEKDSLTLYNANKIDTDEKDTIPPNIDAEIKKKQNEVEEIRGKKENIDIKYKKALKLSEKNTTEELTITPEELTITPEEEELVKFNYLKALDEFRNAKEFLEEVTYLDKFINGIVNGKATNAEITEDELKKIMENAEAEVEAEEALNPEKKAYFKNEIETILKDAKDYKTIKVQERKHIDEILIEKFKLDESTKSTIKQALNNDILFSSSSSSSLNNTIEELKKNIQHKANDLVDKHIEYEYNNKITKEPIDNYIDKYNTTINGLVADYITKTYITKFDDGNAGNNTLLIPKLQNAINDYNTTKTKKNLDKVNEAVANLKKARDAFKSAIYTNLKDIYSPKKSKIGIKGIRIPKQIVLKEQNILLELPKEIDELIKGTEDEIDNALAQKGRLMRHIGSPVALVAKYVGKDILTPTGHFIKTVPLKVGTLMTSMTPKLISFLAFVIPVILILALIAYYIYLVWFTFHRRGALETAKKIQFQCGSTVMEKYTVRYPSNFALEHEKDCNNFLIVTWILLLIIIGIIVVFWAFLYKIGEAIPNGLKAFFIGILLLSILTIILSQFTVSTAINNSDAYKNSSENKQIKAQIALLIKSITDVSSYQTLNQPLYFLPDKLEKRITGRILTDNNITDPSLLGISYYTPTADNSAIIAEQVFPYLKLGLDSDDIELLYGSSSTVTGNILVDMKSRINLNYVEGITTIDDKMGIIGYYENIYRPIVWMTIFYSIILLFLLFKMINSNYRAILIGLFFLIYLITFFIIYTI